MILSEKIYDDFNVPYFSGRINGYDDSLARFKNTIFLSTSFCYASYYAKYLNLVEQKDNGTVFEFRLNRDINIFDANNQDDYDFLKNHMNEKGVDLSDSVLNSMKRQDWVGIFNGNSERGKVIDLILSLGYDGFFNYEYTTNVRKMIYQYSGMNMFPVVFLDKISDRKFPAIGVVEPSSLYLKNIYKSEDDFLKNKEYKSLNDSEKEYIKDRIYNLRKEYDNDTIRKISKKEIHITSEYIDDLIDNLPKIRNLEDSLKNELFRKVYNETIKTGMSKTCINGMHLVLDENNWLKIEK